MGNASPLWRVGLSVLGGTDSAGTSMGFRLSKEQLTSIKLGPGP